MRQKIQQLEETLMESDKRYRNKYESEINRLNQLLLQQQALQKSLKMKNSHTLNESSTADLVQTRIERISKNLTSLEQRFENQEQFQLDDDMMQETQRNELNEEN